MSQRNSEYARKARDHYDTPEWVTEVIIPYIPVPVVWEPAAGSGQMAGVLRRAGKIVHATDYMTGTNFLARTQLVGDVGAIVTNPPYKFAQRFIEHALDLTEQANGLVAMLLRVDFDSAKSRRHLFADCPQFACQVKLTERIVWFNRRDGKRPAPSENHAWFIWSWQHKGPPTIRYARKG